MFGTKKFSSLFRAGVIITLLALLSPYFVQSDAAARTALNQPNSPAQDAVDADDPSLSIVIGAGNSSVHLENSQISVNYGPFFEEHEQFAITDFILKTAGNYNLVGSQYLDADEYRGTLDTATITYNGTDRKTVRLQWNSKNDPVNKIVHNVSIFPNERFLKIEYTNVKYGVNIVDLSGISNGTHAAYGGEDWIRDYVTLAYTPTVGSYFNSTNFDGVYDPADGGSLNYHGHFILGLYQNDKGLGRVLPVSSTEIIKLLLSEDERRGFEIFPNFSYHDDLTPPAFTGYIFAINGAVNGAEEDMISYGQYLADVGYAPPTPSTAIKSDDFKGCSLNPSLWTFVKPVGDETYEKRATQLAITAPAGSNHEIWGPTSVNRSPRLLQTAENVDFEAEAKFDSGVSLQYQMQGIVVEQDSDNLLRFEFFSDGSSTKVFAAQIVNGEATAVGNPSGTTIGAAGISPLFMRVKRVGSTWTQSYSPDGDNWTTYATFTDPLTVAKVGPYAGNTADTPGTEPAHTAVIDYFFNTASRIEPEDGDTNTVTTSVSPVGSGTVTKNPALTDYACNAQVQLTATAEPGWTFSGWSGALTGSTNPATLAVTGDHAVTANFTQTEYTLTVNTTGSGSVTRNPEKATYHLGDQVTLTAAAETGWAFSEWSGGASGSTNPVTVTINGNTTVNAAFIRSQYTLTVNKVGGGSVNVNPPGPFNYDDTIILTATADPNWAFSGWSGDISGSENPKVIKISGNTTVTANFVSTIKKVFIPLVVR